MTKASDPMQLNWEAMQAVKDRLIELRRKAERDLVTRPAAPPPGQPLKALSPEERRQQYLMLRGDQYAIRGKLEEQAQRYGLEPGMLPRNVVEYFIENERELQRHQERQ